MSAPTSWAWTFYDTDGASVLATSTSQNPSHTYGASGTYFTKLVATNAQGSGTVTNAVTVAPLPGFAFVRTTIVGSLTGATPQITLPALAAGNLGLCRVHAAAGITSIDSVTDALGNTYTARGASQSLPGGGTALYRTFTTIADSGSASSVVVTAHLTGSASTVALEYAEYTPLLGAITFVGSVQATGSGASPADSGAVVATVGGLGLFGFDGVDTISPTAPANWGFRDAFGIAFDNLTSVLAGTYHFQPVYTGTQNWLAQLLVFTSGGGGGDTTAPSITIVTPSPPTATLGATPATVSGTASDDVAVTSVTWTNAATIGSGTAIGTTAWSAVIPLIVGDNLITMTAHDAAGHTTDATITITLTSPVIRPPDATSPPATTRPPTTVRPPRTA